MTIDSKHGNSYQSTDKQHKKQEKLNKNKLEAENILTHIIRQLSKRN